MDPVTTVAALAAIAAWMNLLLARHDKLREAERAAINALFAAVDATERYTRQTAPPVGKGEQSRDRTAEDELSRLWRDAGDAMFQMDMELAERCSVKSGYWDNPSGWDEHAIAAADINLTDISAAASKLRRKH